MKVYKYKYNPNKAGVFRISVVKNPAVGEGDLVLMSAQEVKGIFYSPVMIPDLLIDRIDENGEPYKVSYDADTVEQLAINYFKQCGNRNTNLEHEADNVDGVYPVESWIVQDSETDKSKAIGMPTQKVGTWIMGYKADNPEVLDKIKNNLLQGLSIEGQLDKEEDVNNPITKFNNQTMEKKLLEAFADLKTVIMSAISGKEEGKPVEEMAAEDMPPAEDPAPAEPTDAEKEIASLKAELEMKDKQIADLEAELATYKNDATLMSSQVEELKKSFEDYKTVQMSSRKLADIPAPAKVDKPYAEMSNIEKVKYNRGKL